MAVQFKLLYNNFVAASTSGVTTNHTPTTQTAKGWLVQRITFTPTANMTISLYVKQGTGGTPIYYVKDLTVNAGTSYTYDKEITLNFNTANPDILASLVSVGSGTPTVDIVITGMERDQ